MADDATVAHVRARRSQVQREIEALRAELEELDVTERVLLRLSPRTLELSSSAVTSSVADMTVVPLPVFEVSSNQRSKGTLEELIRTFLLEGHKTGWATANEIKDWLDWKTGRDVPMSSVSPTLSNMKAKGLIFRDGLKVAAKERASLAPWIVKRENGSAAHAMPNHDVSGDNPEIITGAPTPSQIIPASPLPPSSFSSPDHESEYDPTTDYEDTEFRGVKDAF